VIITVVMDGRFEWANGVAYSSHMAYHPFAERFVSVFDGVQVCARAYSVSTSTGAAVTGPGATFRRLGDYKGARSFIRQIPRLVKSLWELSGSSGPVLAYLPGTLPIIFGFMRLIRGRPLYSLVVADPADQLQKGALKHSLRHLARNVFVWSLRLQLKRSSGAMYVTKTYLQKRYPATNGREFATSDVFIGGSDFGSPRPPSAFAHSPITLTYVAMMAQNYKGHDNLLLAFAKARSAGASVRLKLIGDGPLKKDLQAQAQELGVLDHVDFIGKISHGLNMIQQLDSSDIFVMTSRAEGLPRAMVEAMARGLPVLATNVGGVPELVNAECLVESNDVHSFSEKIVEFASDPDRLSLLSAENIKTARYYSSDQVDAKIKDFYRFIFESSRREA
jgi:glycosyltransferase involved in cell wall biosynthesis